VVAEFVEAQDGSGPINISSGTSTSIGDLAEMVRQQVGFAGRITWDTSKPEGQMVKIFAVARLEQLGLSCRTPLREGLAQTVRWFAANYDTHSDDIRL